MKFWMVCDIALDLKQTKMYYDAAQPTNDTTACCINNQENEEGDIQIGYFVCSVVSLFSTPLIVGVAGISIFTTVTATGLEKQFGGKCACFIGSVGCFALLPVSLVISCFIFYLIFPISAITLAIISLLTGKKGTAHVCGENLDEAKREKLGKFLSMLKLAEQFGEAIPQAILATVFYARHSE